MFWWCHCQQNTVPLVRNKVVKEDSPMPVQVVALHLMGERRLAEYLSPCILYVWLQMIQNWIGKEWKIRWWMSLMILSTVQTICDYRVAKGCHGIMRLIIKELVKFNVDKWKGVWNVIFHVQYCLPMQQHSAVFQGWGEYSKPSASGRGNLATWAG